jgi:hypothetical protein
LTFAALCLLLASASCGGGGSGLGGLFVLPGAPMTITLASGGGAMFPAGAFATPTDVLVTDELTDSQRAVSGFPPDSGALLGGTRIVVPPGAVLAKDITVFIAVRLPVATTTQFTIFAFDAASSMWETTEAGVSSLRGISAKGQVMQGNVVKFRAPTAGTSGLATAYGVFAGYQNEAPGVTNHIPTVGLASSNGSPAVAQQVTLTATGADTDGDALSFTWLAPGATLGTPSTTGGTSTVTWVANAAGTYVASVSCSDGNGGVATDAVTLVVGIANDPPAFTESGTPPAAIKGDVPAPVATQKVKFTATATDPNNDSLTVTWTDNTGAATNFTDAAFDASTGAASTFWAAPAAGDYTVTATVDDGKGGTDSATYSVTVGVLPTDFSVMGEGYCAVCHTDIATAWAGTPHATALETHVNTSSHGLRNQACYTCHSAGHAPVGSGGFIDQELTPQFANIQCESCHGSGKGKGSGLGHMTQQWDPGKGYEKDATGAYVKDAGGHYIYDASYDGSAGYGCGLCHEGARHGAFEEWVTSVHANFPLMEDDGTGHMVPTQSGEASCVQCHNGKYFVAIQIDGEDPPADNLTAVDESGHITCATCHDPHEKKYDAQLRVDSSSTVTIPFDETGGSGTVVSAGMSTICVKCHNGRRTKANMDSHISNGSAHFGFHPNSQATTLFGVGGIEFDGFCYDREHPHNTWNTDKCVTCHMYRAPYDDATQSPTIWGHNWVPRWEACATCHPQVTDQASYEALLDDVQTETQALLTQFENAWPAAWKNASTNPPGLTSVESAVGAGDGPLANDPAKGDIYRQALWDYYYVAEDRSLGVHNPRYEKQLLEAAIAKLNELNAMP